MLARRGFVLQQPLSVVFNQCAVSGDRTAHAGQEAEHDAWQPSTRNITAARQAPDAEVAS